MNVSKVKAQSYSFFMSSNTEVFLQEHYRYLKQFLLLWLPNSSLPNKKPHLALNHFSLLKFRAGQNISRFQIINGLFSLQYQSLFSCQIFLNFITGILQQDSLLYNIGVLRSLKSPNTVRIFLLFVWKTGFQI